MRYIAIEEAFSLPEVEARVPKVPYAVDPTYGADWERRLADFTEWRLPEMDAAGIDIQVLSYTVPGLQGDMGPLASASTARMANDRLAAIVSEHPDRFRGFAALPLQDPEAAVAELDRAVTDLGLCGALVNNGPGARWLDAPRYDELWSALERLEVPLYLHPSGPPAEPWAVLDGYPELYGAMWSWAAETGGHALRLVFGGVFDRHPHATLILGHMGEFLPFQRSRIDSRWRTHAGVSTHALERLPSAYLGTNVVFTTSGVFSPATIAGAIAEVGADAVLFSVDYPYESSAEAVAGLEAADVTEAQRELVAHGNAERLLHIS